eukprot:TRINITY_DN1538_c1_g1_i2.p1 TRINITY_DN1538_c1_g1~~TRINITY_DN1538_c1_g1_i2.p1  ORF type:complete len:459 (-),score=154.87 TRINITY_DN1538_c1_g1_i2:66-1442(-)
MVGKSNNEADTQLNQLVQMFPTLPKDIIQQIFETHAHNFDKSVDSLLSMGVPIGNDSQQPQQQPQQQHQQQQPQLYPNKSNYQTNPPRPSNTPLQPTPSSYPDILQPTKNYATAQPTTVGPIYSQTQLSYHPPYAASGPYTTLPAPSYASPISPYVSSNNSVSSTSASYVSSTSGAHPPYASANNSTSVPAYSSTSSALYDTYNGSLLAPSAPPVLPSSHPISPKADYTIQDQKAQENMKKEVELSLQQLSIKSTENIEKERKLEQQRLYVEEEQKKLEVAAKQHQQALQELQHERFAFAETKEKLKREMAEQQAARELERQKTKAEKEDLKIKRKQEEAKRRAEMETARLEATENEKKEMIAKMNKNQDNERETWRQEMASKDAKIHELQQQVDQYKALVKGVDTAAKTQIIDTLSRISSAISLSISETRHYSSSESIEQFKEQILHSVASQLGNKI